MKKTLKKSQYTKSTQNGDLLMSVIDKTENFRKLSFWQFHVLEATTRTMNRIPDIKIMKLKLTGNWNYFLQTIFLFKN